MEANYSPAVNPLAFALLVAMCMVTLFASQRAAVKAILFTSAIVPLGQMFIVGGVHLHFFRILVLAGVFRLMFRGDFHGVQWNIIDKLTIWWVVVAIVCGIMRGLKVELLGYAFTSLGCYFLVRCLCKGPEDFLEYLRFAAVLVFVIALTMWYESVTLHNPYSIFGGVPLHPAMREGRARSQGPFRIFILAGAFCATFFPLMVGLWLQGRKHRFRAALGIVGSLLGTYFCNSSGPLMCVGAAVIGFALWPMRNRMKLFRRGLVVMIAVAAVVMKAPVWYLIARVGDLVGGGSWHRAYLIDVFFQNIPQWFLIGTDYTANWAPAGEVLSVDPNNMDITNNYIMQGVRGGICEFALFLAIIAFCFKFIGQLVRGSSDGVLVPKMRWALGVALAGHCTAFIDISYFDQIAVFWYWLVAVIACFSIYIAESDSTGEPAAADGPDSEKTLAMEDSASG